MFWGYLRLSPVPHRVCNFHRTRRSIKPTYYPPSDSTLYVLMAHIVLTNFTHFCTSESSLIPFRLYLVVSDHCWPFDNSHCIAIWDSAVFILPFLCGILLFCPFLLLNFGAFSPHSLSNVLPYFLICSKTFVNFIVKVLHNRLLLQWIICTLLYLYSRDFVIKIVCIIYNFLLLTHILLTRP